MEVRLNRITGVDDAIVALRVSKRNINPDIEDALRESYRRYMDHRSIKEETEFMKDCILSLRKWGSKHITLLKFIDLNFTVYGLHRGGQDDWDSHTKRFDNRIVRSSTRLATFGECEKSDYYKDKIMTTAEACRFLNIDLPDSFDNNCKTFVKVENGYVDINYKKDKDVLRGLYPLCIPSNFIFSINLAEFAHVYKMRNEDTTANPEVQELAEKCMKCIEDYPLLGFTKEFILSIDN